MGCSQVREPVMLLCLAGMSWLGSAGCSSESSLSGSPHRISNRYRAATAEVYPTISETFETGVRLTDSLSLNHKERVFSEDLKLTSVLEERTGGFQQIRRQRETRLFRQGSTGTQRSDVLRQENLGILDLQVIIDNSRSMAAEQLNLATKLTPLIKEIQNVDWQINILTTDPGHVRNNRCSRAFIRRGNANADEAFRAGVTAGVAGNGQEQGFRLAVHGLSCASPRWVRPNSSIAVLIVSDEDNCSKMGEDCKGEPYANPDYLLDYLRSTGRTLKQDARVYGLIKLPGATNCREALHEGIEYKKAIDLSGGRAGSICDADYTPFLAAVSKDLTTLLKAEFELTDVPNAGSLRISVNNILLGPASYQVIGKTVRFSNGSIPPVGAVVRAEYRAGTVTPILSRFFLGEAHLPGSLEVLVNGTLADPSSYKVEAGSHTVVFKSAPPELADVEISFFKDQALPTAFAVDPALIGTPTVVKVNGIATNNFNVLPGGVVNFTEPPAEGANIAVSYKAKVGPQVDYPLALNGKGINLVGLYDKESGEKIEYSYDAGKVRLSKPEDGREGRVLTVNYKDESSAVHQMELSSVPIDGSLSIKPSQGACSHTLVGKNLSLNCDGPEGTSVDISWRYLESGQSFSLPGVSDPDQGVWNVFVNGVETKAFSRDGVTVTLNEAPPEGSSVEVVFTDTRPKED